MWPRSSRLVSSALAVAWPLESRMTQSDVRVVQLRVQLQGLFEQSDRLARVVRLAIAIHGPLPRAQRRECVDVVWPHAVRVLRVANHHRAGIARIVGRAGELHPADRIVGMGLGV